MDYFDYMLQALGVPEEEWDDIDEVTFPALTKADFRLYP